MTEIPRDASGRVIRPRPSQLLMDVMDKLGPDHLTTRTLMAALIERDRGAGVEPRAVTPGYGWHLPVLADPPNVPYDMQEQALDVEATLGDTPRDTGWRNISSLLANGWTAPGGLFVLRAGPWVHLRAGELVAPTTWNGLPLGAAPAGFTPPPGNITHPLVNISNAGLITNNSGYSSPTSWLAFGNTNPIAGGTRIRFSTVYATTDEWPTALPGTPAVLRGLLDELGDALDEATDPMPAEEPA